MTLRVGDLVTIINSLRAELIGQIATITEIDGHLAWVELPAQFAKYHAVNKNARHFDVSGLKFYRGRTEGCTPLEREIQAYVDRELGRVSPI